MVSDETVISSASTSLAESWVLAASLPLTKSSSIESMDFLGWFCTSPFFFLPLFCLGDGVATEPSENEPFSEPTSSSAVFFFEFLFCFGGGGAITVGSSASSLGSSFSSCLPAFFFAVLRLLVFGSRFRFVLNGQRTPVTFGAALCRFFVVFGILFS